MPEDYLGGGGGKGGGGGCGEGVAGSTTWQVHYIMHVRVINNLANE